jgi:hypothetical protein
MWLRVDCAGQRTAAATAAVAVAVAMPACFAPTYLQPLCSADGQCPAGLMCTPQVAGPRVCQPPGQPGGPTDAGAPDAPGVNDAGCTAGVVDVCGLPAPTAAFDASTAVTINTDTDPRCRPLTVAGRPLCLIYATAVTIAASGALTVTGGRPLALVSASTMAIGGAVDAGSHGAQIGPAADDASCAFAANPEMDMGGAGGAAGGSFTLAGGNGGTGDTDNSLGGDGTGLGGTRGAAVSAPPLRGGCRGQKGGDEQPGGSVGGAGGHAGGALYLAARESVSVAGSIRATGAGGAGGQAQAGGGGGGSGGMVMIESASIKISGQISANGGGGGQGGGRLPPAMEVTGIPGADGALGKTPAAGGFGANGNDNQFSAGGAGGADTAAAGSGTSSILAGGGGGGAAGVIRLIGTTALAGSTISPPAS